MKEFENLVGYREETVDGVGPWYWIASDTGAWDGPKKDWEEQHKHKWFQSVTDFRVCIQAGACQGMYPRLLSNIFELVYTFEPDRLNFYVANLNCQKESIRLYNAALGAQSGSFTGITRQDMANVGMHKTDIEGTIPFLTIDSFNFPHVGLIALDIEGHEYHALSGAIETIKRCSPVITTECPSGDTIALLTSLGYVHEDQSVSDTVWVKSSDIVPGAEV